MQKREHLKKIKKDKLNTHKWLPDLLNLKKEEIEKERAIEARLQKLKTSGFFPFDTDDPIISKRVKKYPAYGAKHIQDLFEFRDILIAIISKRNGHIRIFTRIYNIQKYTSKGRQWRSQLAGDVIDAWFRNHKFRFHRNSFIPEAETFTDELKLRLASFLSDFTFEQNIYACEICGKYFLRYNAKFKTCSNMNCSLTSVQAVRKKLRIMRDKKMREYWESVMKKEKKWGEWKREYRFNQGEAKSDFYVWFEKSYPKEFHRLKSYGLIRVKM